MGLRVEHGTIVAMAPDLLPLPGETVLDAEGMAITPGLFNGHTHAAMTLWRGFGDDMPLMEWLQQRIWPAEARMTEEDVYWGTRLACLEMIRTGTVRFEDMYWHFHGMARAVDEMGLRAGVGAVMIDLAGPEQAAACRAAIEQTLASVGQYSDRVHYTLTPHAIYTVSESSLRWVAEFAGRHDLPVHIHLSETRHEVEQCLQAHGVRPALYLDRVGLLGPRTLLAHGVYLDGEELDRIAERGALLVTNPSSNMKLAVGGVFPYPGALARGCRIALGTDGAASNNALDLFREAKTFALIQKHHATDPTVLPAAAVWEIATGQQAGVHGPLQVGAPADFLLLRHAGIGMVPEHALVSNLVYAATGEVVDTVVVAGRVLMRHQQVEGADEILYEAQRRALRLVNPGHAL
jgi:5-methylthioadenosine/S-adenosylhomocysteine deaminase